MGKFNGAFLIYKEKGMTSHDVVFKLRKIIKDEQIGHTGTLDPMATGLLICLVGPSVKLLPYLGSQSKEYQLELRLGIITDTWDISGKVLEVKSFEVRSVTELEIHSVEKEILNLKGVQEFEIPMYSAKKIDGVKLYERARSQSENQSFLGPQKTMEFWDLKSISIEVPKISLSLWCSKGSFIRSWVYQLGKKLGTGATLCELERLSIDAYQLSQAQRLSEIEEDLRLELLPRSFISQSQLIKKFDCLSLNSKENDKILNGLISYDLERRLTDQKFNSNFVFCTFNEGLVAITQLQPKLKVNKVFKNS